MIRKPLLILLFLPVLAACRQGSALPTATPTATPVAMPTAAPGELVVEPAASLGPISPYLLGSNYGPWIAVPVDMLPAAYASGVTAIRFPGGAWGDRNDLKSYQIDAFIAFCREVGAMPTISVRLREGTPEAAAELVRYTNIEKEYGVTYWSIGNEPTLFAAELQTAGRADDYTIEQYLVEWRALAEAMKAVDPTIKLMGPEVHQFTANAAANPKDSAGKDWMIEFLRANGDLVDVVTYHRYPFPRSRSEPDVTINDLRQNTREWEDTVVYLRGLINDITGRDIPIALTEVNQQWNAAIGGIATPDSHYNAIWLAEMLGRLMRQDIFMVNHWLLTSPGTQGGWGLIGRGELRPSYYVFQLYSHFGQELLHSDSGLEDVSVYAARRDDGALTILVINLADADQEAVLRVSGGAPGTAELWRLDPAQRPEAPSAATIPADGRLSLPAQSVSLYVFAP
jgi:hypothetical protein